MDGSRLTSDQAIALIEAATRPADLFGTATATATATGTTAATDAATYRRLARLTHPDTRPGDVRAAAAFAKLAELWNRRPAATAAMLFARGDIANLYRHRHGRIKIARDPADNDLIRRESAALTHLASATEPRLRAYFPKLIEAQRQRDPATGVQRHANVLAALTGFRTLAEVRAAYPAGLDPRDAAWMWRRLLVALGAAHRAGVVHAAVLPEHMLIHPADHGLVLIDWCYSAIAPTGLADAGPVPAIVSRYRDWYPPEFRPARPVNARPGLDIWLATRCMTELIGPRLPAPMASFAAGSMLTSPDRRPDDAWRLLAEFDELLARLFGPRRFRPFEIPA